MGAGSTQSLAGAFLHPYVPVLHDMEVRVMPLGLRHRTCPVDKVESRLEVAGGECPHDTLPAWVQMPHREHRELRRNLTKEEAGLSGRSGWRWRVDAGGLSDVVGFQS